MSERVFVAGHRGLVGSALVRRLEGEAGVSLILRDRAALDLTNADAVDAFFRAEAPDQVYLAAAKVGGIHANDTMPVDFLETNLRIQLNVISSAARHGVDKLLFLGSSCIYPREAPQPMREEHLLTGPLEPTNQWYALAKIAGIKLCQAYRRQHGFNAICAQPTNLYGPGDNFHPEHSHVIPALLRRFHEARVAGANEVAVWGSGEPRREFLHVDDLAEACVHLMRSYDEEGLINVGVGHDVTIRELVDEVVGVVGYEGAVVWDRTRPDGAPRKLLDISRIEATGWTPRIDLRKGLEDTYAWFQANRAQARGV